MAHSVEGQMTVERLARATGRPEKVIANALFRIVKMAKERGATVDEHQALVGLGEVIAIHDALQERRHAAETTDGPALPHEYP